MKRIAVILLLSGVCLTPSFAQSGVYMKLGDIRGEILDGTYKGWIQLESLDTEWSHPEEAVIGSTRHRGRVIVGDIVVSKTVDASTPQLMKYAATGANIPAGAVVVVKGGLPILRYDLRNVLVDAYTIGTNGDESLEEIAFRFDEILVTYLPESQSPLSNSFQWTLSER
ncbi:MAG: type VI secretion system tube protein Hcp [Rhodothermales bacterium]